MEHRSRGGRQSGGLARAASSVVYSIDAWCAVCIVCVAVLAWAGRHQMNPDGLSYLDLGTEAANGGPGRLISGYWSPAYPALIAAVVAVFRPSAAAEFPAVHLLNFGIFLFTLWAFRGLAVEYLHLQSKSRANLATPFAFSMLLGLMVWFVGPAVVTPDLLTAGIVFLACRLAWKLTPASSYWKYSGLGLLLSAAYYAKSAMFLLGVVLLVLLGAAVWNGRLRARGVLASATVFAAGCCPLIVMVSAQTGHADRKSTRL